MFLMQFCQKPLALPRCTYKISDTSDAAAEAVLRAQGKSSSLKQVTKSLPDSRTCGSGMNHKFVSGETVAHVPTLWLGPCFYFVFCFVFTYCLGVTQQIPWLVLGYIDNAY